nr:hypothetical protein [Tanacetum cinerariifolium]
NSLNDSSRISETSSQSPSNINQCCYECGDPLDGIFCKHCPCKSCGKDAHIGYNCPSKVPVISNPEPCNNQTIDELPQTLPIFHLTFHSEAESPFTLDSTPIYVNESPNVFNPPPQPSIYPCEFCGNDAYYGHYCTPQAPLIYPEPCYNQDFNFPQYFQDLNSTLANIQDQMTSITSLCKLACQVIQKKLEEKQLEEKRAAKAKNWKLPVCYDDDDDEESSKSLKDNIIFELPPCVAVTPNEPVDSLIIGDEHLNTISATKSDEFIKSYVENLVPNPNVLKKIYSNPLFDEEIIPMEIDPNSFNNESDLIKSMLNNDSSIIIPSKIDSLFDEFAGELTLLKSIPPGIDETYCHLEEETRLTKRLLYDNSSPCPPEEFVSDNSNADIKSFSPSPIPIKDSDSHMEEIDLSLNPVEPNSRDFTKDVVENISPMKNHKFLLHCPPIPPFN